MGNEEDEEPLEAEIPRVRMNPKNPTSREKQEHEASEHAVDRSWCAACVEVQGVGEQHRIELVGGRKRTRERTTPIVAFDYVFHDTGKRRHVSKSDLPRQQAWSNGSGHAVNGKVPQHAPFDFLLVSSKILVFAESF